MPTTMQSEFGILNGAASAFVPAARPRKNEAGVPTRRFVKDLIRTGHYKHPEAGWDLDVTPERMDKWVASFRQMKKNGVDVEVPVDHSFRADDVRGYLVDMYRDGDTLYGVHEMIGDGIALAARARNVSVWIEPDFKDGEGNAYGEAIVHSSIVQKPVVPGQAPFRALSRSGVMAPLFTASSGADTMNPDSGQHSQETDMPLTADQIKRIREITGAGDDLTEANFLDKLSACVASFGTEKETLTKQITALSAEVETLKKAQPAAAPALSAEAEDSLVESAEGKIDGLVAGGKITPAVAASLKKIWGEPGKRQAFLLSRSVSKTDKSIMNLVIDALAQNNPVELGERTKSQAMALSRQSTTTDGVKAAGDLLMAAVKGQGAPKM